jgi:tetratricopeptide (TPR) repeat protein
MNNYDLKRISKKGYNFTKDDIVLLQKTIDENPYFQLAHIFLSRAKYLLKAEDYVKSLNTTAMYSPDREILFDFIYKQSDVKSSSKQATAKPLPAEKTTQPAAPSPITEAKQVKISPPVKEDGTEVKSKEELRDIVREQLRRIEKERSKKAVEEKQKEKSKTEKQETVAQKDTTETKRKDKKEILDAFIKKEPSVSRPKDGPYDETLRLAKESLEDHFDFVSETLAEIYYKQDNPEKAIKIYEQLILKLPEKKLYFAARIKEIVDNK